MKNMKKISGYFVVITCVLVMLFGCSNKTEDAAYNTPSPTPLPTQEIHGIIYEPKNTLSPTPSPTQKEVGIKSETTQKPQNDSEPMVFDNDTQTAKPTDSVTTPAQNEKKYCSLVVSCKNILDNMEKLKKEKHHLIPENGIILSKENIEFHEGENAFNVLSREIKREKIHMEFAQTPIYNSVYIEGINNIYEFDCGSESGWSYSVNGNIPNYGISQHILKNGDKIEVFYICDWNEEIF